MGKLHDLSRYGRCPHGRIAKPGACPDCGRETRAQFEAALRYLAEQVGAQPGEQVTGYFCPGHEVVTITIPEPETP